MAELSLSSSEPTSILSAITTYLDQGGSLGTLLSSFIFGIGASLFIGAANIINAVVTFLTSPFTAAGEAIGELFSALLTDPLTILSTTAQASAQGIAAQFGWLAFPVGVGIVLGALYMINEYRERRETGDTIPGLPFDVPDVGPFQIGTTEEGEDER